MKIRWALASLLMPFLFVGSHLLAQQRDESFEATKAKAENGDAKAQHYLGIFHYAKKDYDSAVRWMRKAAEQGDADSQTCLGECYELGRGVAQDYAEALRWYRKAADQGWPAAECDVGNVYAAGKGVMRDFAEA